MKKNNRYPKELLVDIEHFFKNEKKIVIKRLEQIKKEDPYNDPSHANSNADVGEDAAEEIQHEYASSNSEVLEKKLKEINMALLRIKEGSYGFCKSCGELIDTDRLSSNPFTQYCISCAKKK